MGEEVGLVFTLESVLPNRESVSEVDSLLGRASSSCRDSRLGVWLLRPF